MKKIKMVCMLIVSIMIGASALSSVNAAVIDDPINGTYYTYTPGDESNNFNIEKGQGFWVTNSEEIIWDGRAYESNPDSPPTAGNITPSDGEIIYNTTFDKADVNQDGELNILDISNISLHFDETGEPGWIPADVNEDGKVNSVDLSLVAWVWTGIPDMVLSVNVEDPDGETMDVYFFDSSDDSLIDVDTGVLNGETATAQWSNLETEVYHEWYVLIDDGDEFIKSNTSKFKFTEENELPSLSIHFSLFNRKNVDAEIENKGSDSLSDIYWNMSIKGGILGLINLEINGTIEELEAGGSASISNESNTIGFGLGMVDIVCYIVINEKVIQEEAKGLVLGKTIFVF